jgi:hypothetical protein
MRIRYGHICGCCTHCGGTDFDCLDPDGALTPLSELRCRACGLLTPRSEVMCRIGDEAMRQARAALRALAGRYKLHRGEKLIVRASRRAAGR